MSARTSASRSISRIRKQKRPPHRPLRKRSEAQLANEKTFRDRALEASKVGLTGFAKEVADLNAEIGKRTVLVDQKGESHRFALTRAAWNSIIDETQKKLQAFKDHFAQENRKALADYLRGEGEAAQRTQEFETHRYQQRVQTTPTSPAQSGPGAGVYTLRSSARASIGMRGCGK